MRFLPDPNPNLNLNPNLCFMVFVVRLRAAPFFCQPKSLQIPGTSPESPPDQIVRKFQFLFTRQMKWNVNGISRKFGGADQRRNAANQHQRVSSRSCLAINQGTLLHCPYGRRILKGEAIAGNGGNSFVRKSTYRIGDSEAFQVAWRHGLASKTAPRWQTRFRLSQAKGCRIRRRMFLAWVSVALSDAKIARQLLEAKNCTKQAARRGGDSCAQASSLVRSSNLGTQPQTAGPRSTAPPSCPCFPLINKLHNF